MKTLYLRSAALKEVSEIYISVDCTVIAQLLLLNELQYSDFISTLAFPIYDSA